MARIVPSGRVAGVRVIHSVPALDVAAMRSVLCWRYRPAIVNGEPATVWLAVPVKFTLH